MSNQFQVTQVQTDTAILLIDLNSDGQKICYAIKWRAEESLASIRNMLSENLKKHSVYETLKIISTAMGSDDFFEKISPEWLRAQGQSRAIEMVRGALHLNQITDLAVISDIRYDRLRNLKSSEHRVINHNELILLYAALSGDKHDGVVLSRIDEIFFALVDEHDNRVTGFYPQSGIADLLAKATKKLKLAAYQGVNKHVA
ncbi:hypothetical protein R6242_18800 [Iodobacter sp. CM08]|uniref:hypothetical protein n=1 Tax=Iodobacter sp. CM08 TaxID=3085902 RepID=UPI0029810F82|nr:hypothetical protein [Iodobacter sp. CM08]MDW5418618.1 hypothetical protein [Iodobacter sp. CM08]